MATENGISQTRRNHMPKKILLSLFIFTLMGSVTTFADGTSPFTFRVPVDVYQMNDKVEAVRVFCTVYKGESGTNTDLIIAQGASEWTPLSNHAFKGILNVTTVLPFPDRTPLDAKRWKCDLAVKMENGDGISVNAVLSNSDAFSEYLPAPNTPYTVELEGEIRQMRKDLGGGLQ